MVSEVEVGKEVVGVEGRGEIVSQRGIVEEAEEEGVSWSVSVHVIIIYR